MRSARPVRRVLVVASACALVGAAHSGCTKFSAETPADAPAEGGNDGAPTEAGADGAGQRFCPRTPEVGARVLFCADFDDEQAIGVGSGWSLADPSVRDVTEKVSPPASLRMTLAPNSGDCAYSRVLRTIQTSSPHVRVRFAVRFAEVGASPDESLAYMLINLGGPKSCSLIFIGSSNVSSVVEQRELGDGGGFDNRPHGFDSLAPRPRQGAWTNVEVEANRITSSLDVRFDGQSAFATAQQLGSECVGVGGDVSIQLGLHCEKTLGAPKSVQYDNVLVLAVEP